MNMEKKMSLLALWIKAHTGKDGSFLPDTVTADFVDDVNAKVEELRMLYPKKSQQDLEDEAFHYTMYSNEIPDLPLGYGLGVGRHLRGAWFLKEERLWKISKED